MGVFLDLVLLLAIAKEAMTLSSLLPFNLWASMGLALPFFVGMAGSLHREATLPVYRDPIRAWIAQGLSLLTLFVFFSGLRYQDLAPAYWSFAAVGAAMYLFGRVLGFLMRSLLFLLVVLAVVFWLGSR